MLKGFHRRLAGVCVVAAVVLLAVAAATGRAYPAGVWLMGLNSACPGFATPGWAEEGFSGSDALATVDVEQRTEDAEVPGALRRWYLENGWAVNGMPTFASITWTLMHGTAVDGAGTSFAVDVRLARLTQNFDSHFMGVGFLKVTRSDNAKVISQNASSFGGSFVRGWAIHADGGVCAGPKPGK